MKPLCEYCSRVPLDPLAMARLADIETWIVGTWSYIQASVCPLCELISFAVHEGYRNGAFESVKYGPDLNQSIKLLWVGASGPGHRGGFHLIGDGIGDVWLCFGSNRPSQCLVDDCRYLQPLIDSHVDILRVRKWIQTCDTTHGASCVATTAHSFTSVYPGLETLRLLDVEQDCLVETQRITQYAALSYIWGGVSNFRLSTANRTQLLLPGSLKRLMSSLPTTLRDALNLTRKLGIRYLWIDALCLLQNVPDDVQRGVRVMDRIYENSWLTIIAACGHNANAGLPGLEPGSRFALKNSVEVTDGVTLGLYIGLDHLVRSSVYNSRAWTFQEDVLSRRALYFVDQKVFFRCRLAEYSEVYLDHPRTEQLRITYTSMLPDAALLTDPINDYAIMLLYYTKRLLTNEGDVLMAMAGIIRRVSEMVKYRFFQGLPPAALDAFITFQGSMLRRRRGFPSYSWVGWRGCIDCIDLGDANSWLAYKTWIIWYKRSASGVTNLVWDIAANESFPVHDQNHVGYRQRRPFHSFVPLGISTVRTAPTEQLDPPPIAMDYPLLQFWTLALWLKLSSVDAFSATCSVCGQNGAIGGELFLDGFEESTFFSETQPLEFVILSYLENTDDRFYAMLVEWADGVAERRGMGWIPVSMTQYSFYPGPQWKEILLA
ncbi:heterokaryon incompatibility protein-domain-containing protein [Stachybotrys elegans]|uniref:Heterokaryon incompatibility protein-domain-containing protein n=1 Tax=Stachybotrys elegans TaxID=80388 RepID=A0A8K0SZ37_9HYPO|nr:heterokaryon incompatibility protein-domain-containing protein [Stachybotrys elegans]